MTICIGGACRLKGSREIIKEMRELVSEDDLDGKVGLNGFFCSGNRTNDVYVTADNQLFLPKPEDTKEFFIKEVQGRS